MRLLLLFTFLLAGLPAFAENPTDSENKKDSNGATNEVVGPKTASPIFGELQIRPSWGHTANEFHTENTLNLGYRFSPDFRLGYTQFFNSLLIGSDGKLPSSPGLVTHDGFLQAQFSPFWANADKDLTLEYESRLYFPTDPAKRANGLIAASRNYLTLIKKVNSKLQLIAQEIPVLYAYAQPGSADGKTANPIFENRLFLIASYDITPKLNFAFPLLMWVTFNRDFGSNTGSRAVQFVALIWPELMYQLAPTTSIGLSYYTGSLVKPDLSGLSLFGTDGGMTQGIGQFVFRQTL